ncbi:Uncharacterized protein TCM_027949 [Theobroma cacao]|uniref:Uncharacterized protein n=1 Tax=Theobroma cacao TaxID=3641 RepID=A0A061GAF5_THECC|nr:Uncharacterized protein TCM_027949 [Theobroma cacao]
MPYFIFHNFLESSHPFELMITFCSRSLFVLSRDLFMVFRKLIDYRVDHLVSSPIHHPSRFQHVSQVLREPVDH